MGPGISCLLCGAGPLSLYHCHTDQAPPHYVTIIQLLVDKIKINVIQSLSEN